MVCSILDLGEIIMTHTEFCDDECLEEISFDHTRNGDYVTRWCTKCGAIVIDLDYDGRTLPGEGMKMRFPESLKI